MECSDWISLASLFISTVFGAITILLGKKLKQQQLLINEQTISQNKRNEEKEKKALICATTFKAEDSCYRKGGWRIRVFNKGEGVARNIRIISPDIEDENSRIELLIEQDSYPILNKEDHFDIVMILYTGHKIAPIIKFVWDDDFGKDQFREQALNLTF